MRVSLLTAPLHYDGGLQLHTASSGNVGQLDALYLLIEDDAGVRAVGETRLNISYLNGLDPDDVTAKAVEMIEVTPWALGASALLSHFDTYFAIYPAPVRMLVDIALHDWAARLNGVSVAQLLVRPGSQTDVDPRSLSMPVWSTNQTLFWSSDAAMLERAQTYVARGYHQLKLRVGIGKFDDDLRRLDLLRARFGDTVSLSADANGQWSYGDAASRLKALSDRGLAYIEQPVPAGDWSALKALAAQSPLTIMLDESLQSEADVLTLCELADLPLSAHLKLVKLGGLAATVRLARELQAAGVPLMIGQMNEGAVSTAAALHACAALAPQWSELYGADGLIDDPAAGLVYEAGGVHVTNASGLGVELTESGHACALRTIHDVICSQSHCSKESFNA